MKAEVEAAWAGSQRATSAHTAIWHAAVTPRLWKDCMGRVAAGVVRRRSAPPPA